MRNLRILIAYTCQAALSDHPDCQNRGMDHLSDEELASAAFVLRKRVSQTTRTAPWSELLARLGTHQLASAEVAINDTHESFL